MDGFTGEIRLIAFDFAPKGYLICDGSKLDKNEYIDLYRVVGDAFNTDNSDSTKFQIPDLRDRFVLHPENNTGIGKQEGKDTIKLSMNQMPEHNHNTKIEVDNTNGGEEPNGLPSNNFLNNQAGVFSADASENTFLAGISEDNVGNATDVKIKNAHVKMMYVIRYSINDNLDSFIGEIRIWPNAKTNDAISGIPKGWKLCNGETLQTSRYGALNSIIGYKYGGSIARNEFKLPNFTNKFASGVKESSEVGETGGNTSIRIELGNLPNHNHNVKLAVNNSSDSTPHVQIPNNAFINSNAGVFSTEISSVANLGGVSQENRGGWEGLDITNSNLGLNYIICTEGAHNLNTKDRVLGETILFAGFNIHEARSCNGASLPVSQYQSLYSLLNNKYGGNAVSFKLPNLINKIPLGTSQPNEVGIAEGANSIKLTPENLPSHNHNVKLAASNSGYGHKVQIPNGILNKDAGMFSTKETENTFLAGIKESGFAGEAINIRNPFLAINYLIVTNGKFPSKD